MHELGQKVIAHAPKTHLLPLLFCMLPALFPLFSSTVLCTLTPVHALHFIVHPHPYICPPLYCAPSPLYMPPILLCTLTPVHAPLQVGVLVAKTLANASANPFIASAAGVYNPVLALDVFLVQVMHATSVTLSVVLVSGVLCV